MPERKRNLKPYEIEENVISLDAYVYYNLPELIFTPENGDVLFDFELDHE